MTRKCFYSFHYEPDNWRASQIREMGSLEGNRPATDNDWEEVKKGGRRHRRLDQRPVGQSELRRDSRG